jgi:hypothetical protein
MAGSSGEVSVGRMKLAIVGPHFQKRAAMMRSAAMRASMKITPIPDVKMRFGGRNPCGIELLNCIVRVRR